MHKILVVDNDTDTQLLIKRFLSKNNYDVAATDNGDSTIEWMKKNKPDLVLCDLKLADISGIQLMGKIKESCPEAIVIIVSEHSTVKDAIEALKSGAYDYIAKPLFPDELLITIRKALTKLPNEETITMPDQPNAKKMAKSKSVYNNQYITGCSLEFAEITRQTDLVAPTNFSVIIYGESGCGKEAIAQQIHQKSKRSDKPFIAIDCGALSKELSGSELFGHEKGAFTGAINQKIGSLELANGGTIFLDEIGNLSYDIQVSLLRAVQERKIKRVGGLKEIDLDVRIITASNINLRDASIAGKFREDLYHRFNEFSIVVPSLHERKEDIMLFAHHFLKNTNGELGKDIKGFTKEVEYLLTNYTWYGNIRELKNVIKRATLLTDGKLIELKSLPFEITNFHKQENGYSAVERINEKSGTLVSYELRTKKTNLHTEYDIVPDGLKQQKYNRVKWLD